MQETNEIKVFEYIAKFSDIFDEKNKISHEKVHKISELILLHFYDDNSFINKINVYSSLILEAIKNSYDAGASKLHITCISNGDNELMILDDAYESAEKSLRILSDAQELKHPRDFVNLFKQKSSKSGDNSKFGGNNLGILSLNLAGMVYARQSYDSECEDFQMALVNSPVTNGVRLILKASNSENDFNYSKAVKEILYNRESEFSKLEHLLENMKAIEEASNSFMQAMSSQPLRSSPSSSEKTLASNQSEDLSAEKSSRSPSPLVNLAGI